MCGKYILIQKIKDMEWIDGKVYSVIRAFNYIFECVPEITVVDSLSLLPLVTRYIDDMGSINPEEENEEDLAEFLQAPMIMERKADYPKAYLTYIGNIDVGEIPYKYEGFCCCWTKDGLDEMLMELADEWKDVFFAF